MERKNTILINGEEFRFEPGETILEVALRNGIHIPTICYLKGVSPTGACRICIVEVEGARNLVASCCTPVTSGMVIRTESPRVVEARRLNLELLLSSGNHNCLAQELDENSWTDFQLNTMRIKEHEKLCPAYGECKLQDLAIYYRVRSSHFAPSESPYSLDVNPFLIRDFSRCILCGRCVQVCNEIQVNNAISLGYRGSISKVVAKGDGPLTDSDCVFCGECIQACPVGALVPKSFIESRALPNEVEKIRTTCPYCGVGCQIYLHVKDNRVIKVTGVDGIAPNNGSLCAKGRFGYGFLHHPERLTKPLIKEQGKFREASWDEALDFVSNRLKEIKDRFGPDAIGFFTSAKATNEENYIAQKFTRIAIGTNNIDNCDRLSHSPTDAGLTAAFGIGAMTNTIADLEKAEVILVTGSNTTETHPVISSFIKRAVTQKGTKLIVVDPRKIHLTRYADIWMRPKLGTDVAWINGMIHVIIKEDLYDKEYVESRTTGFEDLKKVIEKYDPEYVERTTGIPKSQIIEGARLYANAKAASIVYGMGITQHVKGTDNVKSLANLAMLCGNVGVEGGGVNPLRGQNNVQGACDMGALPDVYSGYQRVDDPMARDKMEKAWGVKLPEKPGLTVTEMIKSAHEGKIKALYIMGANPIVSDPDTGHVEEALGNLDFLVVQDIFLTETAKFADVVLPSLAFAEKDGTFTNTERRVQRIRKAIPSPGEAKEDWKILCEISMRLGYAMNYDNSKEIMREIASVTPSYSGITYERIEKEGLHWPCSSLDHPGTPILHMERFVSGRGKFHVVEYIPPVELPDNEYPFFLTTGRTLYKYQTGSMTIRTPLNEISPEGFVEISKEDAKILNIKENEIIKVASRRGEIKAKALITDRVDKGTIFIPFHYASAAANVLTNTAFDPVAKIPEYKVCAVKIEKI